MIKKPKVVFDTQILLRAAINRKSICAKIIFDLADHYDIIFSEETRHEIEDVLSRPALRNKFSQLTDAVVDTVLKIFDDAQEVQSYEVAEPISRDPKDDKFLICAVAGQVQYLVSEDKDILVLNPYEDIAIVDALYFLEVLRSLGDETAED